MASFIPKAMALIARSKIPFSCTKVTPGDGNCFFHAIVDQLERSDIINTLPENILDCCKDHFKLRQSIVSFIRTNENLRASPNFQNLKIVALTESGQSSFEEYLYNMEKAGIWADSLIIYCTSKYLEKNISLAVDSRPPHDPWEIFMGGQEGTGTPPSLTIAYLSNVHFQSIRPLDLGRCRRCTKPFEEEMCISLCFSFYTIDFAKKQSNSHSSKNLTDCACCKRTFKCINRHLSKAEPCMQYYGFRSKEDFTAHTRRLKKIRYQTAKKDEILLRHTNYNEKNAKVITEKQKLYNKNNVESIQEKKIHYRAKNIDSIREKHTKYNKQNSVLIRQKQAHYNKENADILRQKQAIYNKENAAIVKQKQTIYNKENADTIKQKQTIYNKENVDTIKQKQTQYNKENADAIKQKQTTYNKENADAIKQKQAKYNRENADMILKKQKKYNTENKEKICSYQKQYNLENKTKISLHQAIYNRENLETIRNKQHLYDKANRTQKRLSQHKYDNCHKKEKKQKQSLYNSQNKEIISMKQAFRRLETFDSIGEKERFLKFKKSIQESLSYICSCCKRIFFKDQVVKKGKMHELKNNLDELFSGLFNKTIQEKEGKNEYFLCHTCNNYLFKKKHMPPLCYNNGLQLDNIPECLKINEIESTLIAKNIIFLKLFQLPVSRWSAIKDTVVNVPVTDNDLQKSLSAITSLPRSPNEAGLIAVQLKRKLSYKNVVLESFVDPTKLIASLAYLKKNGHPGYKNVKIEESYNFFLQSNTKQHNSDSESSSEDDFSKDPTRKDHQEEGTTLMLDDQPEMRLIVNKSSKTLHKKQTLNSSVSCPIAPGEGKIPINLLRDDDWDINAFPQLHPSGKFGLHQPRSKPLSAQQYFNQRLLNSDKRFSSYPPYVFSALYYIERQQLEQKINVSFKKGTFTQGNFLAIEDGFSIFDKIPGTPRYWQQKKYELLAKMEQLGPFQMFFTLSMADKRWEENFTAILAQRGCKISFHPAKNSKFTYESDRVFIDDIPIEEYLANENRNDLLRKNILTLTRNFDHRVKAFIRHIVRGPNNPLRVAYYTYRVEFQVRGAAHVHGVLWLDLDRLEDTFPRLSIVLTKLSHSTLLGDSDQELITQFVDKFVTVSSDSSVSKIVQDVQKHNHTKTCRKRGAKSCRFGFPRFPSKKTIISRPLRKEDFADENQYTETMKNHVALLDKVKFELDRAIEEEENIEELSIGDILGRANVSEAEYYKALSISPKGIRIILKRQVKDAFINNYNEEWLRAWNGNMDLQICLDRFAIVTYITDYYSKDESGTTKVLKEAANQNFSNIRDKMKCLAQVFLTHRQVGLCEAFYRIMPSLHLSESNVKCIFVQTGFPWNRSRFLEKISKKCTGDSPEDSAEDEMDTT